MLIHQLGETYSLELEGVSAAWEMGSGAPAKGYTWRPHLLSEQVLISGLKNDARNSSSFGPYNKMPKVLRTLKQELDFILTVKWFMFINCIIFSDVFVCPLQNLGFILKLRFLHLVQLQETVTHFGHIFTPAVLLHTLSLFLLFRATTVAYGSSQAKGRIGAAAARLHCSLSNTRSELHLQTSPKLTAIPDP